MVIIITFQIVIMGKERHYFIINVIIVIYKQLSFITKKYQKYREATPVVLEEEISSPVVLEEGLPSSPVVLKEGLPCSPDDLKEGFLFSP